MAAPSAGNQQPWEFYVVSEKETIKKLSECSPYSGCAAGAPVALVPFGYPDEERKQQDRYDESRVHYYQASDC